MSNKTSVHIIRAFAGPRHSKLEFIWDCIAESEQDAVVLDVFSNPGAKLSHAECYKKMWEQALGAPGRYALLTKFDFLPDLGRWLPLRRLTARQPVIVAEYVTRDPDTRALIPHGMPGARYILADKKHVGSSHLPLDFAPCGKFNDPANGLDDALVRDYGVRPLYLIQADCMPLHWGTRMLTGEHLFWSRHLHDDPMRHVAGFHLGDIQRRHDIAVNRWCANAPDRLRRIMTNRLTCKDESESCSSSTPVTSSSSGSGGNSQSSGARSTLK